MIFANSLLTQTAVYKGLSKKFTHASLAIKRKPPSFQMAAYIPSYQLLSSVLLIYYRAYAYTTGSTNDTTYDRTLSTVVFTDHCTGYRTYTGTYRSGYPALLEPVLELPVEAVDVLLL